MRQAKSLIVKAALKVQILKAVVKYSTSPMTNNAHIHRDNMHIFYTGAICSSRKNLYYKQNNYHIQNIVPDKLSVILTTPLTDNYLFCTDTLPFPLEDLPLWFLVLCSVSSKVLMKFEVWAATEEIKYFKKQISLEIWFDQLVTSNIRK